MSRSPQNPAVSTGCHIATGPRIGFLDGASGEDPLLLDQNRAGLVVTLLVCPNPRGDVVDRINDVLRTVIADHALRALGGIAADRQRRVD
jgi:hypothetical protein